MRLAFTACQAKIFGEEIFAGTNFRDLAFDRENRENSCLAKISRYTVLLLGRCGLLNVHDYGLYLKPWQIYCRKSQKFSK